MFRPSSRLGLDLYFRRKTFTYRDQFLANLRKMPRGITMAVFSLTLVFWQKNNVTVCGLRGDTLDSFRTRAIINVIFFFPGLHWLIHKSEQVSLSRHSRSCILEDPIVAVFEKEVIRAFAPLHIALWVCHFYVVEVLLSPHQASLAANYLIQLPIINLTAEKLTKSVGFLFSYWVGSASDSLSRHVLIRRKGCSSVYWNLLNQTELIELSISSI